MIQHNNDTIYTVHRSLIPVLFVPYLCTLHYLDDRNLTTSMLHYMNKVPSNVKTWSL
ncbi:hypothetical protein Mapa_012129 [Marchantia paleacea]|nr:hypothetical protein Mapa_012129 [Marchantia paleacea]